MAINETDPKLKVNQPCVCEAQKVWEAEDGGERRGSGSVVGAWVFDYCIVCTMSEQCFHPADTISCLHCFNLTLNVQCVKCFSRAFMNEFNMHTHFLCFALLCFALHCFALLYSHVYPPASPQSSL